MVRKLIESSGSTLPDFNCELHDGTNAPTHEDLDLARLLNVWDARKSISRVPKHTLIEKEHTFSPQKKALIVGTSYVFGMLEVLDQIKAFSGIDFLFYDKTHYYSKNKYTKNVRKGKKFLSKKMYKPKRVLKHDIVILESTTARLHQLGFGFIEGLLNNLKNEKNS